jgi:methionine-rich copper-binding protein CopC
MNHPLRFHILGIALVSVLAVFACSDDDGPTGGGTTDTTPPGVASITAADANHVEVVFSEAVTRASAEDTDNYTIILGTPHPVAQRKSGAAAGGTVSVFAASLQSDNKTVILSTGTMTATGYTLSINGVSDTHGNVIEEQLNEGFQGSNAADNTPAVITHRVPAPNATGVPIAVVIEVDFSEQVQFGSVDAGFSMSDGTNVVDVTLFTEDSVHFTASHDPLDLNTNYTIELTGVLDNSGNVTPDAEWTFRTTNVADTSPPTLVSSTPAHLTLNVDVNSNLSLTFSEPIEQNEFLPLLTPEVDGTATWSNGGKTVTFDPFNPLLDDTQYLLAIFPGNVQDLSGNPNTSLVSVVFTTGAALEMGSIAGTIAGDPNSDTADDPTGAFAVAATGFLFGSGNFTVQAVTTVAGNNTYNLMRLADDTYYPLCVLDSNDDEFLDPLSGDAIGFYGIDFVGGDVSEDSVVVSGGTVSGINFPLYDPTSVLGAVSYKGFYADETHNIYVGLFETAGFDPNTSEPIVGTVTDWPNNPFYFISSLEVGPIPDGNYYIGAFLDANDSGTFEPAFDPAGLFGGAPPTAINLSNGNDAFEKNFMLVDPIPGASTTSARWPTSPHLPWLRTLGEKVRQAQLAQQK